MMGKVSGLFTGNIAKNKIEKQLSHTSDPHSFSCTATFRMIKSKSLLLFFDIN